MHDVPGQIWTQHDRYRTSSISQSTYSQFSSSKQIQIEHTVYSNQTSNESIVRINVGDCYDNETMEMLEMPRCGLPDIMTMEDMMPYDMAMGMMNDMMGCDGRRKRSLTCRRARRRMRKYRRYRRSRHRRYSLQGTLHSL